MMGEHFISQQCFWTIASSIFVACLGLGLRGHDPDNLERHLSRLLLLFVSVVAGPALSCACFTGPLVTAGGVALGMAWVFAATIGAAMHEKWHSDPRETVPSRSRRPIAHAVAATAPETVELDEKVSVKPGKCPVCSSDTGPEMVYCPVCKAPHHSDCWAYIQPSCSRFGCPGKSAKVMSGRSTN